MIQKTLHVHTLMTIIAFAIVLPLFCPTKAHAGENHGNRILLYTKPAQNWEKEALPIGNGRLGGMVFGGLSKEHIQFNEDSLWVGDEKDTGAYQAFGDLYVELGHHDPKNYRRELDISRAVHTISYKSGGISYTREYFSSNPAQVLVFRFSADKPGAYTGKIILTDAHGGKIRSESNQIISSGLLKGYTYKSNRKYDLYLDYEAQIQVLHSGGTLTTDGKVISFKNCDTLTIFLVADTNYINQRDKGWTGEHPHKRISSQLAAASTKSFEELQKEHIQDYQSLFNRLTLNIGETPEATLQLPTDERLSAYKKNKPDPDLEELLLQYARYLMISSSRPGSMPANLQGLWNHKNNPPWRSDYHTDVNIQMNYWFVDQANLSECFGPLAEWVYSIRGVRKDATRKAFNTRGWMTRSENGIFGGATYHWVPGDAAWVAQNIWDHFAFTQDKEYLRMRAYAIIKELCEFWEDYLKELADGTLVSPKSQSPEHGPWAEGNSYEQQLIWDLFSNYIEASKALGVDKEFRKKVTSMKSRLLGPKVGRWGQLQEWMVDLDDPNDHHRHLSHLVAVYPCRQISPHQTPALAKAARVSLKARGHYGDVGWSNAWKIGLWARLHDSQKAYWYVNRWVAYNTFNNLFNACWPGRVFQIDGNFGYAAGVCETLLQSHTGEIHLLPALPAAWPTGSVRGMLARGGFEIDIVWENGKLLGTTLRSKLGNTARIRYGEQVITLATEKGGEYRIGPKRFGIDAVSFGRKR